MAPQGRTVAAPGQYAGIPLGQTARKQEALAQGVAGPEVEQRALSSYIALEVEGFTNRGVQELQEESDREGMTDISPRYIINRLPPVAPGIRRRVLAFLRSQRFRAGDLELGLKQLTFDFDSLN